LLWPAFSPSNVDALWSCKRLYKHSTVN